MMSLSTDRPARRGRLAWGLAAVAIQTTLALLLWAPRLGSGTNDTNLYLRYATLAFQGKVPYRDYLVEYPPLSLPFFLLPAAVSRDLVGFRIAFAVEMLLCNAAAVLLVARRVDRREGRARVRVRLAWYTLVFLMLARLLVARYDAAPMLLGFVASLGWSAGRGTLGGLAAGLGTLAKLYPALVVLPGAIRDRARPGAGRGRGTVVFLLTTLIGAALWLGVGGVRGGLASARYHLDRGFEYGSVCAGLQMLAAKLLGAGITIGRDHASFSVVTPWSPLLLRGVLPVQAAALLVVYVVFAGRGARETLRYSGAAVLAFIVTGKVFSPQYLIWLLPYIAVLEGPIARRGRWLFAAVCAATLLAPAGLQVLPRTSLWVIVAYNARNVLILRLLVLMVFGPASGRADDDEDDGESERRHALRTPQAAAGAPSLEWPGHR